MYYDICMYKCRAACDFPEYVVRDEGTGKWYLSFRHSGVSPADDVRIEDASEAVKDERLFWKSPKYDLWYIVDGMRVAALDRLEMCGDSKCPYFFEHFCHDVRHRERLEKYAKWRAEREKEARRVENGGGGAIL